MLVPWINWGEWQLVHRSLFNTRYDVQLSALKRVAAWTARGRVPIAVEATAMLLEASLADPHHHAYAPVNEVDAHLDMRLRLMYSMAVLRMVNGVVDPAQKGRVAASVGDLAAGLNLPRFLVDLRHEATHKALPSLPALRLAAQRALAWLRDTYWEPQEARVREGPRALRRLLDAFAEKQAAALEEPEGGPPAGATPAERREARERARRARKERRRVAGRALRAVLRAVGADDIKGTLVPLLLDGGFLAPPPADPGPAPAPDPASGAARFKRCGAVMGPALAAMAERWPPLAPALVLGAVRRLADEPGPSAPAPPRGGIQPAGAERWDQIVRWVQRLLAAPGLPAPAAPSAGPEEGSGAEAGGGAGGGEMSAVARAALQLCLDFPNAWTRRVVRACVGAVGGDEARLRRLTAALEAAVDAAIGGAGPGEVEGGPAAGSSLDELEAFAARLAARRAPAPEAGAGREGEEEEGAVAEPPETRTEPAAGAWHRCLDWVPCSIGALPHVHPPPLDLPASLDDPLSDRLLVACEREDDVLLPDRAPSPPPPAKRPRLQPPRGPRPAAEVTAIAVARAGAAEAGSWSGPDPEGRERVELDEGGEAGVGRGPGVSIEALVDRVQLYL